MQIDVALRTLDFDMAAMLGPTVTQLIKAQAAAQTDTVKFANAALGLAAAAPPLEPHSFRSGGARELPEGVILGGGGAASTTGAAAATSSLPPRKGSSLAAAAAGRTTPTGQSRDDHHAAPAAAGVAEVAAVAVPAERVAPVAPAVPAPVVADPVAPAPAPAAATIVAPAALPTLPVVMRAEADWEAQSDDDLSLHKDALVLVVRMGGDGWWDARTSDETGSVPANFLAPLVAPPPAHARMAARFAYAPDDPAEVTFAKGDMLDVLTPVGSSAPAARAVVESGWLLVRCPGGAVGFAPSNYLEPALAEK